MQIWIIFYFFKVKETRRTVQDSRSGLQEMAIGHHLNDRGHVIEKKKYRYTGEEEENHEFINLDDGIIMLHAFCLLVKFQVYIF